MNAKLFRYIYPEGWSDMDDEKESEAQVIQITDFMDRRRVVEERKSREEMVNKERKRLLHHLAEIVRRLWEVG